MVGHGEGGEGHHGVAQANVLDEHYALASGHCQAGEDADALFFAGDGEAAHTVSSLEMSDDGRAEAVGNMDDVLDADGLQAGDVGGAGVGAIWRGGGDHGLDISRQIAWMYRMHGIVKAVQNCHCERSVAISAGQPSSLRERDCPVVRQAHHERLRSSQLQIG